MESVAVPEYNAQAMSKPDFKYNLAELCKQIRNAEGLSQEQMAKRIGVTKTTWQNWETGIHQPSGDALIDLLKMKLRWSKADFIDFLLQ